MSGHHNRIIGPVFGSTVQAGEIHGGVRIHVPAPAPVALRGLPPGEGFTGRENELAALKRTLSPDAVSHHPPVINVIAGLAGVGKTALAIEASQRALDAGWFPGGVLFADLQGYDVARQVESAAALGAFLRALGVPGDHIPQEQAEREALYRSLLARLAEQGKRVLVVADNVSTAEQMLPLRPTGQQHRMLVSSRYTLPMVSARRIELDVLSEAEAITLLGHATWSANPTDSRISTYPEQAAALARLCGYLPLALRIVAELLADRPQRPISELAQTLQASRDRLGELSYGQSPTVRGAFEVSYRKLPITQARLFRLLALTLGPHVDLGAAAALADAPEDTTRRALDELCRAHLIQPSPSGAGYRLHDLLRLYAEENCLATETPPDRRAAIARLLTYYREAVGEADSFVRPVAPAERRSTRFASRNEALDWLELERPNLVAAVRLAVATEVDCTYAYDITHDLYWFFELRHHWADWISTHQLALAETRQRGNRRDEATILNRLGNAYHQLRQLHEAANCYQQASSIFIETSDRRGEAQVLANLAVIHTRRRSFDEALSDYQHALRIYREIGDQRGEAQVLANIGATYDTQEMATDAIEYHLLALALYQEIGDSAGQAQIQLNLGVAYTALKQVEKGISYYVQAIQDYHKRGDRRREGVALGNLGETYNKVGRFSEALKFYRQALSTFETIDDPPNIEWTKLLISEAERNLQASKKWRTRIFRGRLFDLI